MNLWIHLCVDRETVPSFQYFAVCHPEAVFAEASRFPPKSFFTGWYQPEILRLLNKRIQQRVVRFVEAVKRHK